MKGHKGDHHRKAHKAHGGEVKSRHHNKAKAEHYKKGGSVGEEFGNKHVLDEANEGMKGGGHIGGGGGAKLGRKRGGSVHGHHGKHRAAGGEVGSDKRPYSSAH